MPVCLLPVALVTLRPVHKLDRTRDGKINESPDRYSSFKALAEKSGGVVLIIEAPNDEAVMSLMLKVGSAGNVKTKTLKALTAEEGFKVIKNLP